MMYIYMLQPKLRSNRLFAIYMLILSASSFSIFVSSLMVDSRTNFAASQVHALATMSATPLLWLLVFNVFIPHHPITRWAWKPFLLMTALPPIIWLVGLFTRTPLFFAYDLDFYSQGYVSMRLAMNGRLGASFYTTYVSILNSLLVLPIGYFAFSRYLSERLRRAARVLLIFALSVGFLYMPVLNLSLALRNMLTPLFAAVGAAWIMRQYRFFSPMVLAMKQVVDNVTIGLLVFDEQLNLLDANAYALRILPIQPKKDMETLTLPQLLARLLPNVENDGELVELQAAVKAQPDSLYQQEIVLGNGRSHDENSKTWLMLNIRPVFDEGRNEQFLGCACTIEDLTTERRTQSYITETHKAIEQYAYNQAFLNDITQAAISASNFDEYLYPLAERLVGLFKADHCYISLWDKVTNSPLAAVAYGDGTEAYLNVPRTATDFSLSKMVYRSEKAISIEDIRNSSFVSQHVAQFLPTRGMLALPMRVNNEPIGALLVGVKKRRQFSREEMRWGEQIAQQLALAISKNQLLASEQEHRALLEGLQIAGQALISTLDFDQVLDRILDEIARVVPYDTVNFAMIENGEARIVRKRDFGDFDTQKAAPFFKMTFNISQTPTLTEMYRSKRPLRITNTMQSDLWSYAGHIKSWMGIPIIFGDEPVAFLMVDKIEPDFYQPQHEKLLVAFANHATLALKHAQLFTEIQRRVTELEALSNVSAALRSSDTVPNILQSVLQAMVQTLSAKVGVAFMGDEANTAVVSQASFPPNFYPNGIAFALGEGITGHVAQTGQLYTSLNIHQDPLYVYRSDDPEEIQSVRAAIALPLISEDRILGVVLLGLTTLHQFADDEIRSLKAMCDIVANGLQRIQLMQTLEARVASRTFDLEMANERLKELDKLKTKFIADVSHELRTPVANLSIYINLLENGNPEKQSRYITILQQQANRLTNLVEATLGLSQLEIGSRSHAFEPIELNPIIEEVMQGHQARADAFGITLKSSLQLDLPLLLGNKTQIIQLITNLVTNGIHYNEKQGEIVVETFVTEQSEICLQVADDGMGIDAQELPLLFDRFYRGQRTGQSNIPGTGLGLAIVKEIVGLHHGDISVESQLSKGTVFCVRFPIYQSQVDLSEVQELA